MKMYSIFDVANWFLSIEPMIQKKVQKLCYFAQAWHLTLYETPLIACKFEAWAHGPMNPELWKELKDFLLWNIPQDCFSSFAKKIEDEDIEFLEKVWNTYGEYNGFQLESITLTDRAWLKARGYTPDGHMCKNEISERDMKIFYKALHEMDENEG